MIVDFKTEQGDFSFVKVSNIAFYTDHSSEGVCYIELQDGQVQNINTKDKKVKWSKFVKSLTEEDWNRVVEDDKDSQGSWYKNYMFKLDEKPPYSLETAIESGKSLMENLEVYLENPVPYPEDQECIDAWQHCEKRSGNWILIQYN